MILHYTAKLQVLDLDLDRTYTPVTTATSTDRYKMGSSVGGVRCMSLSAHSFEKPDMRASVDVELMSRPQEYSNHSRSESS